MRFNVANEKKRFVGADVRLRYSHRYASYIAAIVKYLVTAGFSVAYLLPFLWLLSSSLKSEGQEFVLPPQWWPRPFEWSNFPGVFSYIPFAQFYINTVGITVAIVVGTVLSNVLVAYGFSRSRWSGREVLFNLMLCSWMIPYIVILIP